MLREHFGRRRRGGEATVKRLLEDIVEARGKAKLVGGLVHDNLHLLGGRGGEERGGIKLAGGEGMKGWHAGSSHVVLRIGDIEFAREKEVWILWCLSGEALFGAGPSVHFCVHTLKVTIDGLFGGGDGARRAAIIEFIKGVVRPIIGFTSPAHGRGV